MPYPLRTLQQLRPLLVGFRKQAGLTQQAVAEQLGITQQSYAQFEANPASTSVERLYLVLRLLGVELVLIDSNKADHPGDMKSTPAEAPSGAPTLSRVIKAPKSRPKQAMKMQAPAKIVPPSAKKEIW
jgi:HTH-type transcriptional regulator/antitoxin HipB